jgi:hypothetical protein
MILNQYELHLSLVTILSGCEINNFAGQSAKSVCYNLVAMFDLFRLWLGAVLSGFRTRRSLMLENLALRQQLAVFKRKQPRPRLGAIDKLFWVVARRFWAHWAKALLIVLPDTVARWHRSGFKLYWAMLCKVRKPVGGGRRISQQIRELIFQMVADNPSWGAPRIHGELVWSKISNALKKLGFRSHNFLTQLLSETSRACTGRGCKPRLSNPFDFLTIRVCSASRRCRDSWRDLLPAR